MKVLIACAGTGGHINPALSIASIIKKNEPDSEFLFIGTKTGLENELIKKAGYNIEHIRTGKIIRSFTTKNIKSLYNAYRGIHDSKKILAQFLPDIVIGTGGYICIPVMLACQSLKIPYILHESNSFPGVAVKVLASKAACIMLGFEEAKKRLRTAKNLVYTGTPTKFTVSDFLSLNKEECKKELDLDETTIGKNKKIVLVTGGSQGAKKFNYIILNTIVKYLDNDIFFILASGMKNYDGLTEKVKEIEKTKNIDLSKLLRIEKYIYDMDKMYKVSDLCIMRSGAMSINELIVSAKPSILIPLPYAAENHQLYNAKILEDKKAAKILLESTLNEDKLHEMIKEILSVDNLEIMSKNIKALVNDDIEANIYECIINVVNNNKK